MSRKSAESATPTVSEVLAANVRHLREQKGQTQAWLAQQMRSVGFQWAQATVAAVESGKRAVAIDELIGLCSVLGPLPQLLDGEGRARLNAAVTVPLADAVAVLTTEDPPSPLSAVMKAARGALPDTSQYDPEIVKAARTLGVDRRAVVDLARSLYGRSLADERDARIGDITDVEPRTLQARRGHVTRQLLSELREQLHRNDRGGLRGR